MENLEVDLTLALQLQAQFEEELRVSLLKQEEEQRNAPVLFLKQGSPGPSKKSNWARNGELDEPPQEKLSVSLIDPSWELIDPTPNIHALFLTFNNQFFWGRLAGIEVRWSPRMTLCAGVCCYEGRGGLCSVRLSLPLLKLRPRKDLIETLLHEMIHAYLFVTANNRDRDGHGPEFHKHMYRINNVAGTKISVYHTFHDEVDLYRQHVWQCNGPCRQRRPYFGLVKRSMNRAPGPRDPWWQQHQQSCGGIYTKIQEPEGFGDKKKGKGSGLAAKKGTSDNKDIRKFFGGGKSLTGGSSSSHADKYDNPRGKGNNSPPMKENIPGYKGTRTGQENVKNNGIGVNFSSFNKTGNVHGLGSTATGTVKPVNIDNASRSNVHGFTGGSPASKKPRVGATGNSGRASAGQWTGGSGAGSGLAVRSGGESRTVTVKGKVVRKAENETSSTIGEKSATSSRAAFQGQGFSLGGQVTGASRLLSFSSSSSQPSGTTSHEDGDKSKYVKCPVCNQDISEKEINRHLDECIGDFDDDDETDDFTDEMPSCGAVQNSTQTVLVSDDDSDDCFDSDKRRMISSSPHSGKTDKETYPCPVCSEHILSSRINDHLDTHF